MKPHTIEILFDSLRFDIEAEPPNNINPIRGHSFLAWLVPRLETAGYRVVGPGTEDWGWYLDVRGPAGTYLVGASATPTLLDGVDWTLQIRRARSFREWLRGTGRIHFDDPLVQWLEACVREHMGSTEIAVQLSDARGRTLGDPAPGEPSSR
jgi:hypothetical protein